MIYTLRRLCLPPSPALNKEPLHDDSTHPPENVIGSMERVALAAIDLARAIAIKD
jgi:hypothetical protein